MLATSNRGKIGRVWGENSGEWTGRVEISKEEIRARASTDNNSIMIPSRRVVSQCILFCTFQQTGAMLYISSAPGDVFGLIWGAKESFKLK